ncbi:ShlB/FhaC/HecB family hemolysin secretion/activation protein [Rhodopirellula baltica]|nr:ShlB/FhaC/HecB family hemolysin secretion/activation protein [Rhodopirellula baltica]
MSAKRFWKWAGEICALSVLFGSTAMAQNFERYQPKVYQPWQSGQFDLELPTESDVETPSSDVVLVDSLEAVILVPNRDDVDPQAAFTDYEGIHSEIIDASSLANSSRVHRVIEKYLGSAITLRNLNQMTRDIITVYERCGQPIVDVMIPEQKITGGTVQIVITESRIGAIRVAGGCWVDPCLVRKNITCSRVGAHIYESRVSEDLYWLNRSPFRKVGLDVKPGASDGTSDLIFEVQDVFPMRAYTGYEDTGVRALNLERLFAGVLIGNLFGQDGILGYQYTADGDFARLHAHALSYNVDPCREYGLQLFGSWASAVPDLPAPITQDGEAWQVGSRGYHYWTRTSHEERAWYTGVDFKSSNTSVEFGSLNASTTAADLLQLSLGYLALVREDNGDYARLNTSLNYGPDGGFTSQNNAAAFNSLRQIRHRVMCIGERTLTCVAKLPATMR